MKTRIIAPMAALILGCALSSPSHADLAPAGIWTGNVGLSVDGVGGDGVASVGDVMAHIPVTATILQAYMYSAGTPFPWYPDSPTTLADYNGAGITLAGQAINNFDTLVGATSIPRPDIGQWFTARADVTSIVESLRVGVEDYSWAVGEGTLNSRIDGNLLAIVYSDDSLVNGSVALLDGGQDTAGETTNVAFASPIDTSNPDFAAELGLGISFSCCAQASNVSIDGDLLSNNAGGSDDGMIVADGSLFTVGGLGDPLTNLESYENDRERYDLAPHISDGATGFSLFTNNPTGDDNIFFASLYVTGEIDSVNEEPNPVSAPANLALMLLGFGLIGYSRRNKKVSATA